MQGTGAVGQLRGDAGFDGMIESRRPEAPLKAGALQDAIFNSVNFSSIATDALGVIQIFNVGAERMLGYASADVLNKITPAHISDPQELIARAEALSLELATPITPGFEALVFKASRGIEDIYELTYIRKDGSRFPAIVSVTALRDAADAIIGYLLIGTNNTARKQTEAELQRANALQLKEAARQIAILNALPAHIALLDRDGFIVSVNDQWRQFADANLLKTPAHCIGVNYLQVFGGTTNEEGTATDATAEGIRSVLDGSAKTFSLEYPCHSPAEERWFQMTVTPVTHEQPLGVIVMHTNITARKRAENEISRLNGELEERVRLRTHQLQEANQELEAFSYSASHDLRTPLSAIDGFSSLLGKEMGAEASERSKHYMSRIRAGVVQMGELIDALLALAQVSRSKLSVDTVDLSAMAQAVLDDHREREPQRQVRVTITPNLLATGDHRLLQEVLDNLLGNAWKYSSKSAQASIRFGSSIGSVGETVYTVQDNGAGFDMAYADKLFKAFQRLHTDAEFAGTGIGLATVHRIVTRHGGRIWAESVHGEGASFHFTLGRRD